MKILSLNLLVSSVIGTVAALPALAQTRAQEAQLRACEKVRPSFDKWLDGVRKEALANGVSQATWDMAAPSIRLDDSIVRADRNQKFFYKSFPKYYATRVGNIRLGRQKAVEHAALLAKITEKYGVPGEILLAFWGMETNFAVAPKNDEGLKEVLVTSATLAYDCRRSEMFRKNLLDALNLLNSRELTLNDLRGEGAGEMTGLQFTPTVYWKYAVDFDNDGRRDPLHSVPDLLASGANALKNYGWERNQPYLYEVKVPNTDKWVWAEADLTTKNQKPLSYWASQGVTMANGAQLPNNGKLASLMLPMGRLGPAFLAFNNFRTLLEWNASLNNALSAANVAMRIKDTKLPPVGNGNGVVTVLEPTDIARLQRQLDARKYDMGRVFDGYLGSGTRAGLKDMQIKYGFPADAYPTLEIIEHLERNP